MLSIAEVKEQEILKEATMLFIKLHHTMSQEQGSIVHQLRDYFPVT